MATHSSTLAWRIPWTEEPGGLQCMRWQTTRHDRSDLAPRVPAPLPLSPFSPPDRDRRGDSPAPHANPPVVRIVHLVQKLVQLVAGTQGLINAPAVQVVAHMGKVIVPLQGHIAHRVPDVLGQEAHVSAADTHRAHPSLKAPQRKTQARKGKGRAKGLASRLQEQHPGTLT